MWLSWKCMTCFACLLRLSSFHTDCCFIWKTQTIIIVLKVLCALLIQHLKVLSFTVHGVSCPAISDATHCRPRQRRWCARWAAMTCPLAHHHCPMQCVGWWMKRMLHVPKTLRHHRLFPPLCTWTKVMADTYSFHMDLLTLVMYLVFTCMPSESYRRWLRSLLLYLCYVFWVLINSLVCWFCMCALGLVLDFSQLLFMLTRYCEGYPYIIFCCNYCSQLPRLENYTAIGWGWEEGRKEGGGYRRNKQNSRDRDWTLCRWCSAVTLPVWNE